MRLLMFLAFSGLVALTRAQSIDTVSADADLKAGKKYLRSARYDSALICLARARAANDYLKRWRPTAVCYDEIAEVWRIQGKYELALSVADSGINLSAHYLGWETAETANLLFTKGIIFGSMGDYERSQELHIRTLELRLKLFGSQHRDVSDSYNNLGIVSYQLGRYRQSLNYHQRALAIRNALFGPDHSVTAASYINTGVVYRAKGDYDEALQYYQKALKIQIKALGEDHPRVATIYHNMGIVFDLKGDYETALEYYTKALRIREAAFGGDHPDVANTYNDIGNLFNNKKDYNRSLEYHRKALNIRLKKFTEANPFVAMSYSNMANNYRDKKESDTALAYYKKVMAVNRLMYGNEHPEVAKVYSYLGDIAIETSQFDSADAGYRQALEIFRQIYGDKHPYISGMYVRYSKLYERRSDWPQALAMADSAADAVVKNAGEPSEKILSDNDLLEALVQRAHVFEAMYSHLQPDTSYLIAALNAYRKVSDLMERMRSGYRAEGSKLFLSERAQSIYEQAIRTSMRLLRATGDERYLETVFGFIEKNKSRVLIEALADAQAKQFAGLPDSVLEAEALLRDELIYVETVWMKEITQRKADSARIAVFEKRLFDLHAQYDAFIRRLEKQFPDYYELKFHQTAVSAASIRKLLNNESAVVDYFTGDSTLVAAVIDSKKLSVVEMPKPLRLDEAVKTMRQGLSELDFSGYLSSASMLYQWLIQPVLPAISGKTSLYIIPDGAMNYLPFEALLSSGSDNRNPDFSKLPYLIRQFNVSYYYSASIMAKEFNHSPEKNFAFAGLAPVFSDTMRTKIRSVTEGDSDYFAAGYRSAGGAYLSGLPFSKSEVQSIAALFQKNQYAGRTFLYGDANESLFKSGALRNYGYLHIASHGLMNEQQSDISGIVLAPEDSLSNEDGILRTREIYGLKLNADLVTLSACKSAMGKIAKGEGLIGLTRAFTYAGAHNILASLWRVDQDVSEQVHRQVRDDLQRASAGFESMLRARADALAVEGGVIVRDPKFFSVVSLPVSWKDEQFRATVAGVAADFEAITRADVFAVLDTRGHVLASVGRYALSAEWLAD
ncbi:CHAT domain-containing protein, partial [bacterium]|nr:CHAT domain-containing protein [bacterium]